MASKELLINLKNEKESRPQWKGTSTKPKSVIFMVQQIDVCTIQYFLTLCSFITISEDKEYTKFCAMKLSARHSEMLFDPIFLSQAPVGI